jgi:repressor LexA
MDIKEYEILIYEKNFEILPQKRIDLGNYLKEKREEKRISIINLTDLTGLFPSDLMKIENGTLNIINPLKLKKIAEVLKLDYKELYKIIGYLD